MEKRGPWFALYAVLRVTMFEVGAGRLREISVDHRLCHGGPNDRDHCALALREELFS
jgi:hypothetical protein